MTSRSPVNSPSLRDDDSITSPADHRLYEVAATIFLAALILRSLYPGAMSVEHFDEGVYASNLYAWHLDNQYPDRQLYAPPLLPALLEWAMILTGGNPHAAMWVNVLSGSLTAALVAWVAGRWFGLSAAVTAGILAVTSDIHIVYSRAALTDALLCLWMLGGVYAGWKAVLDGRPIWIVIAGMLAALAWWTKYNGWLTLAITGAGTAAWLVVDRPPVSIAGRAVLRWAGTVVVAFIAWLPLLSDLQATGGYAAVTANHAKYAVGLTGWPASFLQQLANHKVLNGWLTVAGLTIVTVLKLTLPRPSRSPADGSDASPEPPSRRRWIRVDAVVGGLCMAFIAARFDSTLLLGTTALFALVLLSLKIDPQVHAPTAADADRLTAWRSQRLAMWMVAAWYFGLLLATPLYHPYPRITLPWLVSVWLSIGLSIGRFAGTRYREAHDQPAHHHLQPKAPDWSQVATSAAIAVGLVGVAFWGLGAYRNTEAPAGVVGWEDRTSYARLAREFLDDIERAVATLPKSLVPDYDAIVYVHAEPALYFHLASLESTSRLRFLTQPAGNLKMVFPDAHTDRRLPTFVLTGPHGHRSPQELAAAQPYLAPVSKRQYTPSTLVLLNDYAPPLPDRHQLRDEYTVQLYRLTFGK